MTISPELQAKIDALFLDAELQARLDVLTDEDWRAAIIERLVDLGEKDAITDESLEQIVSGVTERWLQLICAPLRKWRDDEALAFIEFFEKEAPQGYVEFLREVQQGHEVGISSWSNMNVLAERWLPGLHRADYAELSGKVVGYAEAHLI